MLSKKHKILLWIFGAMFVVPEVLWSPVADFYYQLLQTNKTSYIDSFRDNFITNSSNNDYFKVVVFFQLIGLILSLILLIKNKKEINNFWGYLFIYLLILLSVIVGFSLFLVWSFRNGIGF